MGYLQSKLEKKLLGHGFLDTLSLAEIVSLLRIFLLQSESPTKSRLFADMMSMLQNSLREEVAQMLLVSDLSAVKGLAERCSHLYQVLGAVCSVLVSVSRSFYDLQDVSYDAEGRVRVLGTSNADEYYSEMLSSVYENLFQVFMTVRSYALLAAQWRSWQSSSNAKERNEKMTDVILCLARILLSDSSVQKSQNAQKTVCWILEDFTPAEVIENDPALLIMLETSIQKGQMTGPTRKLIERLVGKIDLDRESQGHAETARAYLDALKSDSAYCLQELFRQCSEAIGWTEGNIHEKEFEDEGLGTIHLSLLESFSIMSSNSDRENAHDHKWPSLAECVSHPLNCRKDVHIDCDEKLLANILHLESFPSGEDSRACDSLSEEVEENINAIRVLFGYEQDDYYSKVLKEYSDSGLVILHLMIDAADTFADDRKESMEDAAIEESSDKEILALLNETADALVENAIAWAISQIASSEEEENKSAPPAPPANIDEDMNTPILDAEAEAFVKRMVEDAMAHAVSAAAAQTTPESSAAEVAEQEPEQELAVSDAEAEAFAKRMVEDAMAHAVSAAQTTPESPSAGIAVGADSVDVLDPEEESVAKAMVEDAMTHAIAASVLESSIRDAELDTEEAESNYQEDNDESQKNPVAVGSIFKAVYNAASTMLDLSSDQKKEDADTSDSAALEDASTSSKPSSVVEPQNLESSYDDTNEYYSASYSSSAKARKYENLPEVRSSLEDILITQRGRAVSEGGSVAKGQKKAAQRPWDMDLALFKSLGAKEPKSQDAQEIREEEEHRKDSRKRKPRVVPSTKEEVQAAVECKAATTQTESRESEAVVEPQVVKERDSADDAAKEVILLELKRIKKEYLSAIKEAQRTLELRDPSISKVLGSQAETLRDYDEVLKMAASSPAERREVIAEPQPREASKETEVVSTEHQESLVTGEGDSTETQSSSDEQSDAKARRRARAAQMLKQIVSKSRSRRQSKESVLGDEKKSSTPEPPPPDYRRDMPLERQTENLLDQMEQAVDLSGKTTLNQDDRELVSESVESKVEVVEEVAQESQAVHVDDQNKERSPSTGKEEFDKPSATPVMDKSDKGGEDRGAEIDAKESESAASETTSVFRTSLQSDPAYDLFSHFFEIKSTDPTRHLREKFRSSPHTRNDSVTRRNLSLFSLSFQNFVAPSS